MCLPTPQLVDTVPLTSNTEKAPVLQFLSETQVMEHRSQPDLMARLSEPRQLRDRQAKGAQK